MASTQLQDRITELQRFAQRRGLTQTESLATRLERKLSAEVAITRKFDRIERAIEGSNPSQALSARFLRELSRDLIKLPIRANLDALVRVREAADLARQRGLSRSGEMALHKLERQISNQIVTRQLNILERLLDVTPANRGLAGRELRELGKSLAKLDARLLSSDAAERLTRLADRLVLAIRQRTISQYNLEPRQAQQLARQIRSMLAQRAESGIEAHQRTTRRESKAIAQTNHLGRSLEAEVARIKETMRLQQRYISQKGETLLPADKAQLQQQDKLLRRQLAVAQSKLFDQKILGEQLRLKPEDRHPAWRTAIAAALSMSRNEISNRLASIDRRETAMSDRLVKLQTQLRILQEQKRETTGGSRKPSEPEAMLQRRIGRLSNELERLKVEKLVLTNQRDASRKSFTPQAKERVGQLQQGTAERRSEISASPSLQKHAELRKSLIITRAAVKVLLRSSVEDSRGSEQTKLVPRLERTLSAMQRSGTAAALNADQAKRLQEMLKMLRDGHELSAAMLDQLLETLSDCMAQTRTAGRKVRKAQSTTAVGQSKQQAGAGLRIDEGKRTTITPPKTKEQRLQAKAEVREAVNSKTGKGISAANKGPANTLDIAQSKEDDGEKNEYWKEVHGEGRELSSDEDELHKHFNGA